MLSNSQQLISFWLFGLGGFVITIATFIAAFRTRKTVSKAFEVADFRKQIEDIIAYLDEAKKQIEERTFSRQDAFILSNVLYKMLRDYTFISLRTKKDINNCVFLLRSFDGSEGQKTATTDAIIRITSYLQKEKRK